MSVLEALARLVHAPAVMFASTTWLLYLSLLVLTPGCHAAPYRPSNLRNSDDNDVAFRLHGRVNEGASTSSQNGGTSHSNDFVPLPDGWRLRPQSSMGIRPAPVPASALENLYETMFSTAAQGFWRNLEPFQRPLIDLGELLWFVEPADSVFTVPWHVMAAFAFGMRERTRRGWTNFYELILEGPDSSRYTIYLDLRPVSPRSGPSTKRTVNMSSS